MELLELSTKELLLIDGGANWYQVGTGVAEVIGSAGLATLGVATAGAPVPGSRFITATAVFGAADLAISGVKNIYSGFKN